MDVVVGHLDVAELLAQLTVGACQRPQQVVMSCHSDEPHVECLAT